MVTAYLLASLVGQFPGNPPPFDGPPTSIPVGWNDELNSAATWGPLNVDNKARVNVPHPGELILSLGHVPNGWPYEYQWSGITRDAYVNVGKYPVLMARVPWVEGYAHMDIEVLDANEKPVKGLRSTTLTRPGISSIDLSKSLDPAFYHLRLRLIVGGPNAGCSATYDWVRCVTPNDATFLESHPDFQNVRLYSRILR